MDTFVEVQATDVIGFSPSVLDPVELPFHATVAHRALAWRKAALLASLVLAPAATGLAVARAATRRRGLVAGGLTALAIGTARIQLARWFTPEPAFQPNGAIGRLELRRCAVRVEAVTEVSDIALDAALDRGYGRLACYVCGSNQTGELLERTMPVLTAMRDGRYTVAMVMPPGRRLGELPRPEHPGVELRVVPEQTIAVLRFRGRFTRDNVAAHERMLLQQLIDAGLSARGSVTFAAYDSPLTLPFLRRNEVWIETA
jgi:hypothetical protein